MSPLCTLRKDVPFGVLMMNNHIYGSKVPQNPHFGGPELAF